VLANTARLWAQRQAGRPGVSGRQRRRVATLIAAVVTVVVAAGLALVASGYGQHNAAGSQPPADSGAAAVTSAVAVRSQTAEWVAHQVNRNATIACDPVMCAALHARGFPAANLVPMLPTKPDPLGAEIVVATAAVRSQFGTRLARVYAPQVIASFGSGQARIEIRTIPPQGAAAFRSQLGAHERAARKQGRQLLRNKQIAVSAQARSALAKGRVDSRLLATLAALSARHSVRILAFGDANPGAGPGIPLRSADLATDHAAGLSPAAYRHWLVSFLRAQRADYRASHITVRQASGGGTIVRVEFAAPSDMAGPAG